MKKNQLIINGRDVGKTTYLYNEVIKLVSEEINVIILDSATEHYDKSLLHKVMKTYQNSILIDNHDENKIATYEELNSGHLLFGFPYSEIKNNIGKIVCFDLSYFLEKGHEAFDETGKQEDYDYYRNLYRREAQQILSTLIALDINGMLSNTVVVTDEIEFPIVDFDVTKLQQNLKVISSVHPENSFGTFYQSCEQIDFIPYQKRKEINYDFK